MQLAETVREQMLGSTLRAVVAVPLADAKGITFIEKFSQVLERDYETSATHVQLTADISAAHSRSAAQQRPQRQGSEKRRPPPRRSLLHGAAAPSRSRI